MGTSSSRDCISDDNDAEKDRTLDIYHHSNDKLLNDTDEENDIFSSCGSLVDFLEEPEYFDALDIQDWCIVEAQSHAVFQDEEETLAEDTSQTSKYQSSAQLLVIVLTKYDDQEGIGDRFCSLLDKIIEAHYPDAVGKYVVQNAFLESRDTSPSFLDFPSLRALSFSDISSEVNGTTVLNNPCDSSGALPPLKSAFYSEFLCHTLSLVNCLYEDFVKHNPLFVGPVWLIGDGIGGLVAYDLLTTEQLCLPNKRAACSSLPDLTSHNIYNPFGAEDPKTLRLSYNDIYNLDENTTDEDSNITLTSDVFEFDTTRTGHKIFENFPRTRKVDVKLSFDKPSLLILTNAPLPQLLKLRLTRPEPGSNPRQICEISIPNATQVFNIFSRLDSPTRRLEPSILPSFTSVPPLCLPRARAYPVSHSNRRMFSEGPRPVPTLHNFDNSLSATISKFRSLIFSPADNGSSDDSRNFDKNSRHEEKGRNKVGKSVNGSTSPTDCNNNWASSDNVSALNGTDDVFRHNVLQNEPVRSTSHRNRASASGVDDVDTDNDHQNGQCFPDIAKIWWGTTRIDYTISERKVLQNSSASECNSLATGENKSLLLHEDVAAFIAYHMAREIYTQARDHSENEVDNVDDAIHDDDRDEQKFRRVIRPIGLNRRRATSDYRGRKRIDGGQRNSSTPKAATMTNKRSSMLPDAVLTKLGLTHALRKPDTAPKKWEKRFRVLPNPRANDILVVVRRAEVPKQAVNKSSFDYRTLFDDDSPTPNGVSELTTEPEQPHVPVQRAVGLSAYFTHYLGHQKTFGSDKPCCYGDACGAVNTSMPLFDVLPMVNAQVSVYLSLEEQGETWTKFSTGQTDGAGRFFQAVLGETLAPLAATDGIYPVKISATLRNGVSLPPAPVENEDYMSFIARLQQTPQPAHNPMVCRDKRLTNSLLNITSDQGRNMLERISRVVRKKSAETDDKSAAGLARNEGGNILNEPGATLPVLNPPKAYPGPRKPLNSSQETHVSLAVISQTTRIVVFNIDDALSQAHFFSGARMMSAQRSTILSSSIFHRHEPKIRPGAVDLARNWAESGHLLMYTSDRPEIQRQRVVAWLSRWQFPHGLVFMTTMPCTTPTTPATTVKSHRSMPSLFEKRLSLKQRTTPSDSPKSIRGTRAKLKSSNSNSSKSSDSGHPSPAWTKVTSSAQRQKIKFLSSLFGSAEIDNIVTCGEREINVNIVAAYGDLSDAAVYASLGIAHSHIFVVFDPPCGDTGRRGMGQRIPKELHSSDVNLIADGFSAHFSQLKYRPNPKTKSVGGVIDTGETETEQQRMDQDGFGHKISVGLNGANWPSFGCPRCGGGTW